MDDLDATLWSDYTVWFDPSDWGRVRARLEPFNWSESDDDHLSVRLPWWTTPSSGPLMLPAVDTLNLTAPTIVGHMEWSVEGLVGTPVHNGLARQREWSDEVFCDYIFGNETSRALNPKPLPVASWASVAAFIKTPIYVEDRVREFSGEESWDLYAISADGQIVRGSIATEFDQDGRDSAGARVALREDFFASRLRTCNDGRICMAHYGLGGCGDCDLESREPTSDDVDLAREAVSARLESALVRLKYQDFNVRTIPDALRLVPTGTPGNTVGELHAALRDGSPVVYTLVLHDVRPQGIDVYGCLVDGVQVEWQDHTTRVRRSSLESEDAWMEWIAKDLLLRVSVPAGDAHGRWAGHDVGSMLDRAEAGVVASDEREALGAAFGSTSELQAWVDEALVSSPVRLKVWRLDAEDFQSLREESLMLEHHTYDREDDAQLVADGVLGLTVAYESRPLGGFLDAHRWYFFGRNKREREGLLEARQNGGRLDRYVADSCVDISHLRSHLTEGEMRPEGGWWVVLELEGTSTALAFPRDATMISVETDDDGATVNVSARWHLSRIGAITAQQALRCNWADWYDEAAEITEAKIAEQAAASEHELDSLRRAQGGVTA
jgi:hypothetical protein